MKLAIECPTSILKDIQPLADFDFILSHLVLQDKEYANYYAHSSRVKILDDSTNELLKPMSLKEIQEAAEIVKPDLIIPPDYLNDVARTCDALEDAISLFGMQRLLPVLQGKDSEECLKCAGYYWIKGFHSVAVPYRVTGHKEDSMMQMSSTRVSIIAKVTKEYPFAIHLLGMTNLSELRGYGKIVRSIDTGIPVLMGLNNMQLGRDELRDKKDPTYNLMPKEATNLSDVYFNLAYLRRELNA